MRSCTQRLYDDGRAEIGNCKSTQLSLSAEVEVCYKIALPHWVMLREEVENFSFPSENDKSCLFKRITPLFIAEIEYYDLLYHALLFMPQDTDEERSLRPLGCQAIRTLSKWARGLLTLEDTTNDYNFFLRASLDSHAHMSYDL